MVSDAPAEILDDLPDALTRRASDLLLTAVPLVLHLEQWLARRCARSLRRRILVNDRARDLRQRHGGLVPAFAEHATQPELWLIVANVETQDLGAAETAVDHQRQHGLVPTTRASCEELLDGLPLRDTGDPASLRREGDRFHGVLLESTVLDRPLPEAAEHRETDPDACRLKLLRCHEVLVAVAQLRGEVRDQD
jgi:hypothetical protein